MTEQPNSLPIEAKLLLSSVDGQIEVRCRLCNKFLERVFDQHAAICRAGIYLAHQCDKPAEVAA